MLTFNDILRRRNLHPPLLCGISHRLLFPELDPLNYLELLFRTSADIVQWREKDLSPKENRVYVRRGVELSKESGKLFLVNSLLEVGLQEGASGVHLTSGQDVQWATEGRFKAALEEFAIGKSVHSLSEAIQAESEGVDYVLLGPIFAPLSKRTETLPLGGSILWEASQALGIPVLAVGGLDDSNFQEVFKKGVAGAAGISWVQAEIERLLEKH